MTDGLSATLERWLATTTWTQAHARALAALAARAEAAQSNTLTFEQRWPASEVVDAWVEAALIDAALGCTRSLHNTISAAQAQVLVSQSKRGFGWGFSKDRMPVQACASLLAALAADWDLVASGLGGRPLAQTVSGNKTSNTLAGLVRHIATAARHRLGEDVCASALQGYARSAACRPEVFWALARLAIEGAGGHPPSEVLVRARSVLLPATAAKPRRRPGPIDDPRVSVAERFMMPLTDPKAGAELRAWAVELRQGRVRGWDSQTARFVARASVMGLDTELAETLPALLQLDSTWSATGPSPALIFLAMLGHPVVDWNERALSELRQFHQPRELSTLRRFRWSTEAAAAALATGDTNLVRKLTPGAKKERFVSRKTFGDEPRAVLRYFALALDVGATRDDVTPAWLQLLASRAPDDDDGARTGGAWSWASLWCLAFTYFHRLGDVPAAEVPRLLRETLCGQAATT